MTDFCLIREMSQGRGYVVVQGHVIRCWWCDRDEPHPPAATEMNSHVMDSATRYPLIEFDGVGCA